MEYKKSLVELDEVLKQLPDDEYAKIPEDIKLAIEKEKDKDYNWKYDITKKLNEQNLDRSTIAMLAYINTEYLLNEEEKKLMTEIYKLNELKAEQEKSKKYNPDKVFDTTANDETSASSSTSTSGKELKDAFALASTKKEKWYTKIFSVLSNLFKSKK